MKWLVYICLLLPLCVSCESNPLYEKRIDVVIADQHPWRKVSHRPLWHTLVATNGSKELQKVYLEGGVTSISTPVKRDRLTVFCAYPLSNLFPYGGFYYPGCDLPVVLTQQQGQLASLLLDAYAYNAQAIENLNGRQLADLSLKVSLLDTSNLLLDLLNGNLDQESMHLQPKLAVTLADLPYGYWVSERAEERSFYFLCNDTHYLEAEGLVERWWNQEQQVCLTLFADLKQQRFSTSLSKAPLW